MTSFEIMIDTVGNSAHNIPNGTKKVAGYTTGGNGIQWTDQQWSQFAKTAGEIKICQHSNGDPFAANAFDIEPGALTIADFVRMAGQREHDRKWNSAGYCDANQLGDLVLACVDAKLTMVELWVANWSLDESQAIGLLGTKVRNYPIVAVQYASPTSNPHTVCPGSNKTLSELNLDLSVALTDWFPAPGPAPAPKPPVTPPKPPIPPVVARTTATLALATEHGYTNVPIYSTDGGKFWDLA